MHTKINESQIKPFTKWTGGKRQLIPEIKKLIPEKFDSYYEPFLGGGAVLFDLLPKKAIINDWNADLISLYEVIRDDVYNLIKLLNEHSTKNSSEYYYAIRSIDRTAEFHSKTKVWKASRILYMLKVNYNGLYRVNSKGQFNTPYGRYKNPKIMDYENLIAVSNYLNSSDIKITSGDFSDALISVKKNDFVYLDPPYIPINQSSNFTSYTSNGFGSEEQIRLRDTFVELHNKGAYIMLSNSYTESVYELYSQFEKTIHVVEATRMINSKATQRGKIKEVIITNY